MARAHNFQILQGSLEPVDILAIGPHPDDIEIGAGGSLLLWSRSGYRIGLVDLTRGELGTKGDGETRIKESIEAAIRLEATFRANLCLPDGGVSDSPDNRLMLVEVLRGACPDWVLCNLEEARHPDHREGARLVQSAFFLSRLARYCTEIPPHSPGKLLYYLIHEQVPPTFLVDISPVFEDKFQMMGAYESQFHNPLLPEGYRHTGLSDYLRNVRSLGESWGAQGGVAAAEAFIAASPVVVTDISQWVGRDHK